MHKYDPQGNGTLSLLEFTALKNDLVDDAKADPSEMIKQLLVLVREQGEQLSQLQRQVTALSGGKVMDASEPEAGGRVAGVMSAADMPRTSDL